MADEPNSYVRALAEEYRMCRMTGQEGRILGVVEDLTRHGWSYDDRAGLLVRIQERAVAKPAAETPESPAPKRRATKGE